MAYNLQKASAVFFSSWRFLLFLRQHLLALVGPSCRQPGHLRVTTFPGTLVPPQGRAGRGGTLGPFRLAGAERSGSSCAASDRHGRPQGSGLGAADGGWQPLLPTRWPRVRG